MNERVNSAPGVGRHLLLIDDLPEILETLAMYFERKGYTVSTAENGTDGIKAYRNKVPDVVILDIGLPDMSGIEVLAALRKHNATVVMLTGQGDIPTAVQAMQLGAEGFLTKPPDLPVINATVERACEKSDLRRENVRLQRYAPTTRKRVIRWGSSAVLLVAAAAMGVVIGTSEEKPLPVRDIAPTCQPVNAAPPGRLDTMPFAPGAPPPVVIPGR